MVSNQRGHTSGVTTHAVWTLVIATGVWCAGCAVTRSEVKALRDRDSARVVFDAVVPTTVTALNELPAHCGPAGNRRRPPEELRVYEAVGRILRVRREHDRDIHVVLADLQHPGDRIVVELGDPDAKNARRSPYRDRLAAAWKTFEELQRRSGAPSMLALEGLTVRVTGVGFYDMNHFQRGRSRSCIELHPVLSIEPVPIGASASSAKRCLERREPRAQARDDVGVFLRDVEAFAGIALEVVQLRCRGDGLAPLRRDDTQLPPVAAQRFGNRTVEVEQLVSR